MDLSKDVQLCKTKNGGKSLSDKESLYQFMDSAYISPEAQSNASVGVIIVISNLGHLQSIDHEFGVLIIVFTDF